MAEEDLLVNGPGSPISLKKVIDTVLHGKRHLTVLLDQDSQGFYTADAEVTVINSEICKEHALEFQSTHFNQKQMPLYLLRHLLYFFYDKEPLVYPHNEFILEDLKEFVTNDPEGKRIYAEILNKITYIKNNPEWQQVIGLIITICGCLNLAKKEQISCRLYIEYPETHLHPKREQKFMYFFHEVYNEYTGLELQD